MVTTILGTRIRERRRQIGLTQSALARTLGISASYLNLIERNKRRITPVLLTRTADALDIPADELDGAAERRLHAALGEIALLPDLAGLEIEAGAAGELIGRFPGWARAVAALSRAERAATLRARALSDRMAHDPFLGETVHRMLTRIAAIRTVAEIVDTYDDLAPDQRTRFNAMVHADAKTLSEIGGALAAYFDTAEQSDSAMTPQDEVETLFASHQNRFAEIEQAAEAEAPALPRTTRRARQDAAERLARDALGPLIDRLVRGAGSIGTEAAGNRARRALGEYAVRALLLPGAAFADAAAAARYDVETLARDSDLSPTVICRRLTALPRAEGVPVFGYLQANAAGTLTTIIPPEGVMIPRYAAACPLWALFRAQSQPGTVLHQRTRFPDGEQFVFVAHAARTGATGFADPRHYLTDMLTLSERDAALTVYAASESTPLEDVGPACRLCPRKDCAHRIEDPFIAS